MEWTNYLSDEDRRKMEDASPSQFSSLASQAIMSGLFAYHNSELKKKGLAPANPMQIQNMKSSSLAKGIEQRIAKLIDEIDKSTGGYGEAAGLIVERELDLLKKKLISHFSQPQKSEEYYRSFISGR